MNADNSSSNPNAPEHSRNGAGHGDTPHPIAQNIDTVAALLERAERQVDARQRTVERIAAFIARPLFIISVTAGIALWVIGNSAAHAAGLHPYDPPPYYRLQGLVSLASLYTTLVVVVTQGRQGKVQEQRDNFELQAILLTEQKATKIIALLEELRRDLPNVADRSDDTAELMQETLDPDAVLTAIELKLDQAASSPD